MRAGPGVLGLVGSACLMLALSFTITAVGYGGAAWYVAHAIVLHP